jgi:serine/threonine protein kinase
VGDLDPQSGIITGELTSEQTIPFLPPAIDLPRARTRGEVPRQVGPYVLGERLGAGGMAEVHVAERVGPHGFRKQVALKRLLPHAAMDPDHVRMFLDEARVVAALHHPNIASIFDFGVAGREYFMSMELVRGPTLKQLIEHCEDTVGLIPYPVVVALLVQVCEALQCAHDAGVIHRDVSPANVIVSNDGVAKLIDFGVCKTIGNDTSTGVIKGKFGYIAPEYLDGRIDRRADLWALGVVAYEMLTNRRLFDGDEVSTLYQIREASIDLPSHINPDVPPELDAIVMTALQRDPEQRWQNATALRNALCGLDYSTRVDVIEWVEWAFQQQEKAVPHQKKKSRLRTMTEMILFGRKTPDVGAAMVSRRLKARRRGRVMASLALLAGAAATAACIGYF